MKGFSISDIAPPKVVSKEIVITREAGEDGEPKEISVEVYPLSVAKLARLMERFPELRKQIAQMDVPRDEALLAGMKMLPAIAAAAMRLPEKDEALVEERLSTGELAEIMELSFSITRPTGRVTTNPSEAAPVKESGVALGRESGGNSPRESIIS